MGASGSPTSTAEPIDRALAADRAAVDAALDRLAADLPEGILGAAMQYSLLGGGKRLRPLLVLAAYRACGGVGDASALAAAVEVVHAYSLVHDDLPCMDDDDMRRGRATTHRVYGVPIALAAGVAMVPLAARVALRAAAELGLPAPATGDIVRELMRASGAGGMVGGQFLDLTGEGRTLSLEALEEVHRAKTGALIAASVVIGAIAAGAPTSQRDALRGYGERIGLAFQIADDVLDATGTTAQLGKTAGRDAVLGKSTFPALLGVGGAIARARALAGEACASLRAAGLLTPALERLAYFVVERSS
jgi:geranylgeranyl diphosphate synthase type II